MSSLKRLKQLSVFLFIFLILPDYLSGANYNKFKNYSKKDGLSHTHVLSIYQDSKGFIWFGTYGGLHLFNGSNFQIFTTIYGDSSTISANATNVIFEDREGLMWFGTEYGLNKYDRKTGSFTHYLPLKNDNSSISHQIIKTAFQDTKGYLWFGTYGGGLNKFDIQSNSFVRFNSENLGIPDNEFDKINTLIEDTDGLLWIGTEDGGIFLFNSETGKIIQQFKNLGSSNTKKSIISSIHKDIEGNIWVGTWTEGLFLYDANTKTFIPQLCHPGNKPRSNENIRTIAEDNKGNLWLAHYGDGLTMFNKKNKSFTNLYYDKADKNSISNNFIWSLLIDKNNVLWAGTFGGGLNKCNISQYDIPLYQIPEKLGEQNRNNGISAILEDHNGDIWLGTLGSNIFKYNFDSNLYTPFSFSTNTESNPIHQIFEDFQGQLWVGTDYGLFKIDSSRNKITTYKNDIDREGSISREPINHIYQDRQGNIWLGTNNAGLQLLKFNEHHNNSANEAVFIKYKHNENDTNTISSNVVNSICEDSDGNIWVGTLSNLEKLYIKTGLFKKILPQSIGSLALDESDNIWVGTFGGGFYKISKQGKILKAYPNIEGLNLKSSNNLLNSTILGMVADTTNEIWLATDNGISVYNKQENTFTSYSVHDELKQQALWVNSVEKISAGAIIVGGVDGFNIIWPDSLNNSKEAQKIVFTDFKLANKSIVRDKTTDKNARIKKPAYEVTELQLSYKDKLLLIEFIALEYYLPQNINYAYKLEGFDDDWIITNADMNYATYSNLNPGTYNFLVKATNIRGIWNDTPTQLKITITPPFWQTLWFRALLLIALIMCIVLLVRIRTVSLQKQKRTLQHLVQKQTAEIIKMTDEAKEANEQKLRFFTSISHEFRTPLTLILGPIEHLKDKYASHNEPNYYFSVIQKNAFRLLRLINEVLDLRKIDTNNMKVHCIKADIVDFIGNIANAFNASAEKRQVRLQFHSNIPVFNTWFDPGKLEIIFYNLISNALHYTPPEGKIDIELEIKSKENTMCFVCEDTGIGIESEKIDKIFDRFYQAEADRVFDNGGTGIGLSLTKEIIEILKGEITVSSLPKKGTTFKFNIPIISDAKQNKKTQIIFSNDLNSEPSFNLISQFLEEPNEVYLEESREGTSDIRANKKKLLLVEDDLDLSNFVKSCLNDVYEVLQAVNGKEALDLAREMQPSIIISDIRMPIMDGIEFCRKIKGDLITSHIPVVLLSAQTSLELQIQGFDTGADAFIPKPFSKKYLITRVNAIVSAREKLRDIFYHQISIEPNEITVTSVDEKFITQVKELVEKNMDNAEFGVHDFVKELGISRSLLYTKFKQLTNCTSAEFIKNMRLKRACQLLEQNKYRVSEISDMVGFNNPHSFSKIFKKQFGKTPSQFVKNK